MAEDTFIDIDLDEVDSGREPLGDGVFPMRVASIEKKQKEGKPYPYLDVRVSPKDNPKRKYMHILSYHPDALWNMKLFATACRVEMKTNPETGKKGFDIADFREKEVAMTAYTETYENESGETEPRTKFKPPYHRI